MSRQRILGSINGSTVAGIIEPPNCLICQVGEPSTTETPGFQRGFQFDDYGICRVWSGVKRVAFALSWTYSGTSGADVITTSASFSGTGLRNNGSTEDDVADSVLAGTPVLWELSGTGSLTVTTNADPPVTTSPAMLVDLQVSGTTSLSAGTPDISPGYYYRTDTERWLPNFDINHVFASAIRMSSTIVLTPSGSEQELTKVGQFNGSNFDISVVIPSYATFSAFSCTVDYSEFYPYSGASGAIWNTSTGAELQTHSNPND